MTNPTLPRNSSDKDKLDHLIAIATQAKHTLNKRTILVAAVLLAGLVLIAIDLHQTTEVKRIGTQLSTTAIANKANGDLLVECTTPGTNPTPKSLSDTGNECWDRLHNTAGTDSAIATIVDNIYCDHRRVLAGLPPASDMTKTCRSQTPADVLG